MEDVAADPIPCLGVGQDLHAVVGELLHAPQLCSLPSGGDILHLPPFCSGSKNTPCRGRQGSRYPPQPPDSACRGLICPASLQDRYGESSLGIWLAAAPRCTNGPEQPQSIWHVDKARTQLSSSGPATPVIEMLPFHLQLAYPTPPPGHKPQHGKALENSGGSLSRASHILWKEAHIHSCGRSRTKAKNCCYSLKGPLIIQPMEYPKVVNLHCMFEQRKKKLL